MVDLGIGQREGMAIYVHVPFCPSKCGYCDFNSYAVGQLASGEGIVDHTVQAIIAEIRGSRLAGVPAKTIFFGGGTPTYVSAEQLDELLRAVVETHPPVEGCEITSEANPGTVDASKFASMRASGFNRISLGAQSFLDSDLLRLDRVHRAGDIERAVDSARSAGIENLNLDLMFALPDQSVRAWNQNLARALALAPEHLSLYCLTIEQNTAFYKKQLRNELNLPDDESQRKMYEDCVSVCADHGYGLYEISNFAKAGRECQHNLCYWRGENYAGYGPGAVGCVPVEVDGQWERMRTTNLKHPERYCDAVERGAVVYFEHEILTDEVQEMERIMLGLRLTEGLTVKSPNLGKLVDCGWLEECEFGVESRYRLTPEGRHFCSEVALELIP